MNTDICEEEPKHQCDERCMQAKQLESQKYEGVYRYRDTKSKLTVRNRRMNRKQHRNNIKVGRNGR